MSYETIYKHIYRDKKAGGSLSLHLRYVGKQRRKRYGASDSRDSLAEKRHISERRKRLRVDTVLALGD